LQLAEEGECLGQVACGPAFLAGPKAMHHPRLEHPAKVSPNSELRRFETPLTHCKQKSITASKREESDVLRESNPASSRDLTCSMAMDAGPLSDARVPAFFAIISCTPFPVRHLERKVI